MKPYEVKSLRWFMKKMGEKLTENERKWKVKPWPKKSLEHLFMRVNEEVKELNDALNSSFWDKEAIVRECADVANFAMMIAKNVDSDAVHPYAPKK